MIIKEFNQLINSLLERPFLFRVNRVEDIQVFLIGYEAAANPQNKHINNLITTFDEFVKKEFEFNNQTLDWVKVIRLYSSTDIHSLEVFKTYWTRFIENYQI